jgi:glucose-1-phosphate adenylyltransferase
MKTIGLISANYEGEGVGELTNNRTLASLPYGGRYRLIDFALSNMANSGITTVGVIAPYNSGSLIDHIGEGSPWSLNRKNGGLFLMPGSVYGIRAGGSRFVVRDLLANRKFFEREEDADYVIMTGSSDVFNMDYEPLIKAHDESDFPITMVYKKIPRGEDVQGFFLERDEDGKVLSMTKESFGWSDFFLDCFIADRDFLEDFIKWFEKLDYMDMVDLIRDNIDTIDIGTFEFKGYFGRINGAKDFLRVNQDFFDYDIRNEVFCNTDRLILTKTQDEAPVKYSPDSEVRNSIISAGCTVEGKVENSIIFRSTNIAKGAVVRNSVIMMHGEIGEGALLDNVICDKYVTVSEGVKIFGGGGEPIIIGKDKSI